VSTGLSWRRGVVALTGVLLMAVPAACGADQPSARPPVPSSPVPSSTSSPSPSSPGPSVSTAAPSRAPRPRVGISKVLVVLVENHSLDAMRREMPYTFGLARRYGYATGYRAISHPSLPNYLAISAGDTFGISDDRDPSAHPIPTPSVFGQALAHGRTAKVYAEGMAGTCATSDHGEYAVRHNPWTYHTAERAACRRYDVPLTALAADVRAGRLPDAGMVVPNVCNDAHDCPAARADSWMRTVVGGLLTGPDFRSGRLLVVITADEDDHDQGNLVLTTLVNPQLHHTVVSGPLDHYSLSRLYSEVVGAPPLRRAGTARSLAAAFRLAVIPAPAG
jgi:hypothetical protein